MKKVFFIPLFLFLCFTLSKAQNVAINDDNSNGDIRAILDVKSTTKGVLFPRMTTAQRTTLGNANPTNGMLVFDTETKSYWFFAEGNWEELVSHENKVIPGTIIAYGSPNVPSGYLSCNGASVSKETYSDLYTAISNTWGESGDDFTLPDLRGYFLRGWDNGAGVDPNSGSRKDVNFSSTLGNVVGSYQADEFKSHNHQQRYRDIFYDGGGTAARSEGHTHGGNNTFNRGGSETRPKNAYVHYIIKY